MFHSNTALNRNHTSMLLKSTFLMAVMVTLQIDLSYSYRSCKSFNINPKSSSKVTRLKHQYYNLQTQLNVLI